jgi:HlyD family secretion protein
MADLNRIRLRALVNETDIGNVKPGQAATVVVDAYPDRQFRGQVEKVEPMAVVDQSVTMFPVLVSLSNEDGLLMPGMNGEVTVMVEEQNDALAVPVDAVRNAREAADAGQALGLSADEVRSALRAQGQARMAQAGGAGSGTAQGTGGGAMTASDGNRGAARAAERPADSLASGRGGARGDWRNMTPAQRDSMRAKRARGSGGTGSGMTSGGSGAPGSGSAAGRSGSAQRRVVFVKKGDSFEPRMVRLGVSNYEYAQVLSGLEEGEQVALLSAAQLQFQRQETMDRIRQRTALPGTGSGTGRTSGGGGRSGAGQGGGAPGGGGGGGGGGR